MTTIYGDGYDEAERRRFISVIHCNIITNIQLLVRHSIVLRERGDETNDRALMACKLTAVTAIKAAKVVMQLRPLDDVLTEETARLIQTLWTDRALQATYALRGTHFTLPDSASYFFSRLGEAPIWDTARFVPTVQDVIRSRVRTTGIIEKKYIYKEALFHMFDVGGQRNERRKWIHLFENVTAVCFVASLSAYDQYLYEDPEVNRMHESLNLFEEICKLEWFEKTHFILFLNKRDLFREKIVNTPLSVCFPEYKDQKFDRRDPQSIRALVHRTAGFCKYKFLERNKIPKKIYAHTTNATNTRNVEKVFNNCQDIIIQKRLAGAGLL